MAKRGKEDSVLVLDSVYDRIGGEAAVRATVEQFYERVVADPGLSHFFKGVDLERLKKQQRDFFTQALGGPGEYRGPSMKRAHQDLKIEQRHFDRVATHLVGTLKALGVDQETVDQIVATVAPLAGEIVNTPSGGQKKETQKEKAMPTLTSTGSQELLETLEGLRGAVDSVGTNVFIADRDLNLIYMNRRAEETMKKIADVVEKTFGVSYKELLGASIDRFHGGRARQIRRLLGDESNLPIHTDIQVGPLTLDLNVSGIFNPKGDYIGLVVNWDDVTDKRRMEQDSGGQISAISKAQAVIEFNMDGTIINANDNFLGAMGYRLDEVKGQHHSMFVDEAYRRGAEYKEFWAKLNRGEYEAAEYKRIGKGGKEVWIQASYNPILDLNGKPFKVVKYATEVTAQKLKNADVAGQVAAISKAQAVIEFNMDGTIITANENFLGAMGYRLEEVKGQHHSMFVDEAYRRGAEYKEFWAKLNRGEYESAEYKRIGNGGKEVWIQASYNPILDLNGKPFKVVKFASEVTAQKLKNADVAGQVAAIGKAQAVIEFNMDGTIITANENFLGAMGYRLEEVKGQHHSMFVEEAFRRSSEYKEFWAKLNRGEYESGEYKRIGKGGKEVWIQASYNPILDLNGKPFKVVKYATEVTAQKLKNADSAGQIAAIGKAQAVIEFNMDGTIITANDNFLGAMGYRLEEIKGQHHSMFVDEAFRRSSEYREFWAKLNRGEYESAEYKRIGKGGKEVWIQASYNPILDLNGKPFKVVKFATDVTAQVTAREDLRQKVDRILAVVNSAAAGDLTRELTVKGADAAGQVGEALAKFFGELRTSIGSIGQNAHSLSSASEELTTVAQQMAGTAEESATQANVVSAAAEQVSKNVQVVATGSEEMSASIKEIAKSANESARVAKQAVSVAEGTNQTISKLGDSSAEIGKVIKVITSIAQQTNLLALNATIEAARAGEAGKGFAVVANEVKELAKETAKATEDISQKIEAIQGDTKMAVAAIGQISGIINQINDISNTIASAVEEQTATTNEIGRNVAQAAKGSAEIAQNIAGVATAAQSTTAGAGDTQKAAKSLSEMAGQLQTLVSRFKV